MAQSGTFFLNFLLLLLCKNVCRCYHEQKVRSGIIYVFVFFQTILLQDKQQKNYCVSCQELDSDIDKDNPGMH